MGKLVLIYWDCKYCGTKAIAGDKRECPNCGHPRDHQIAFYLAPQKVTHVEEEKAKKINRNPDWVCSFCNSLNSDSDQNCKSCGATKESSEANYFENKKKREEKKATFSSYQHPQKEEDSTTYSYDSSSASSSTNHGSQVTSSINQENQTSSSRKSFPNSLSFPSVIIIALLCILACWVVYFITTQAQEVTVQNLSWEYTIDIEALRTVDENDWSLPAGARLQNTQTELHHYQDVLDHYETRTRQVQKERITGYEEYVTGYRDLGNGYAEEITATRPVYETYYDTETYEEPIYRKEPVYQTKYYYEIDKWVYERSITTSGNDKTPYWAEVVLSSTERIGDKHEQYIVNGTNSKGKEVHFAISFEDYQQMELGKTYTFKISFGTGKLVKK